MSFCMAVPLCRAKDNRASLEARLLFLFYGIAVGRSCPLGYGKGMGDHCPRGFSFFSKSPTSSSSALGI